VTATWFFAPPDDWRDGSVTLPEDESHHAARVLRIQPPDVITVTDGRGTLARAAVATIDNGRVVAEVLETETRRRSRPEIVVYQGAAKGNKLDGVVQHLAELGVAGVYAFDSERAVARWDRNKSERLGERWNAIARSAAKQSRNPLAMDAAAGISFTELLRRVAAEPLVVVLWEEATLPLRTALATGPERVALVVGPEGGLARHEAESLADAGAQLVSLGPNILRTEHAAPAAAAAVLFRYGLIG
jgi:16S rRNA (uracil1498-N3)-methyltransferase